MVPSGFLQKNSFRRCCILCLIGTILPCIETILAQTDSLKTNTIPRHSSPMVRYGVYPVIEVGFGAIGAGLGGLAGALVGAIIGSPSDSEFGALGFAIIGGGIGIITGSTIVVHQIGLKTGLNSSAGRTFGGSLVGFAVAIHYWDKSKKAPALGLLFPALGATFFAHLGGYKQNDQQASTLSLIRIDTEKDYLEKTYIQVNFRIASVAF